MDFHTKIDDARGIRYHTIKGDINIRGLMDKLESFYKSDQFNPEMDAFWDLRETDMSQVITEEIRLLMEVVKKHWGASGSSKSALLVTEKFEFGLARMYEGLMSMVTSDRIKVFIHDNEAREWLGID